MAYHSRVGSLKGDGWMNGWIDEWGDLLFGSEEVRVDWFRLGPLTGRSQLPVECGARCSGTVCGVRQRVCGAFFFPPKQPPIGSERLESGAALAEQGRFFSFVTGVGGQKKNIPTPLNDGATRGAVESVALASRT